MTQSFKKGLGDNNMNSEKIVEEFKKQATLYKEKLGNKEADCIKFNRQSRYLRKIKR